MKVRLEITKQLKERGGRIIPFFEMTGHKIERDIDGSIYAVKIV